MDDETKNNGNPEGQEDFIEHEQPPADKSPLTELDFSYRSTGRRTGLVVIAFLVLIVLTFSDLSGIQHGPETLEKFVRLFLQAIVVILAAAGGYRGGRGVDRK